MGKIVSRNLIRNKSFGIPNRNYQFIISQRIAFLHKKLKYYLKSNTVSCANTLALVWWRSFANHRQDLKWWPELFKCGHWTGTVSIIIRARSETQWLQTQSDYSTVTTVALAAFTKISSSSWLTDTAGLLRPLWFLNIMRYFVLFLVRLFFEFKELQTSRTFYL